MESGQNKTNLLNIMSEVFKRNRRVACFFQKLEHNFSTKEPVFLMGIDKSNFHHTAGYLAPPNGPFLADDHDNPVAAARRVGREQTGLLGISNMVVGRVEATIANKKEVIETDFVLFTASMGEFKENQKFWWQIGFIPFSECNWGKALPKDRQIMEEILIRSRPSLIKIACGRNRSDVIGEIEISDLYPPVS